MKKKIRSCKSEGVTLQQLPFETLGLRYYIYPLEYFDVMDMKSLQRIIPPEFSDVMIAYVVGGEVRDVNPTNYEK